MRRIHWLLTLAALLLTLTPSWAQERTTYKQTRVNITIRVPNFEYAAADLREVVSQFDGHIQNLNLDHKGTNGNANVKVKNDQVTALVKQLSELGKVQSQNQSTSDNTNSIRNYSRKAKAFKLLSSVDMRPAFAKLPAESRAEVQAEYENWVTNRHNSNQSSLIQYKETAGLAEINLQFVKDAEASEPSQAQAPQASQHDEAASQSAPAPPPPPHRESPAVYILCLVNFLGLWLIYRRMDAAEPTNTPGLHD